MPNLGLFNIKQLHIDGDFWFLSVFFGGTFVVLNFLHFLVSRHFICD